MKVRPCKKSYTKILIKLCHCCGHVIESFNEVQKCPQCEKSFLPLNYFEKIQQERHPNDYQKMFVASEEIHEEDLIRGIHVLW